MRIFGNILIGFTLILTIIVIFGIVSNTLDLLQKGYPINSNIVMGKEPEGLTVGDGSEFQIVSVLIEFGIPFVAILWFFSILLLKRSNKI